MDKDQSGRLTRDQMKEIIASTNSSLVADAMRAQSALSDQMKEIVTSASSSPVADAMRAQAILSGSVGEELRRAMENVAAASLAVDESMARLPSFDLPTYEPPSLLRPDSVYPTLPPNSVYETNSRLDDLNDNLAGLVDVAKHQDVLTQAINEATQATLKYAAQSGDEAKRATKVARTSIWIVIASTVANMALTLYLEHRHVVADDLRAREERVLRERQVRVLDDISQRLAIGPKAGVGDAAVGKKVSVATEEK